LKPLIIVIVGPTAVGKTALALRVAQLLHTEIISADSRQCFREMNIGVAKPTEQELALVPHYFINSHSIFDEVNAALFEQYALSAANQIFHKHDVAVMVGGSGLYVNAFCNGLDAMPNIDPTIRKEIIQNFESRGLSWLQQQIQQYDFEYWQKGEQQNPHRLMRALEVVKATGKSILYYRSNTPNDRPFRILKIGLEMPRAALYERINTRVLAMMQEGLLKEVKQLQPLQQLNALQTVGYKELFDHLNGFVSLDKAISLIQLNTRHYAKRQLTWFKKDDTIQWYTPEQISDNLILGWLNYRK
jgi:tRNA dimethylallyltransferase